MKKYHPVTVMFYVFGFGFLYVLYFGYSELSSVTWDNIPTSIYFSIVFVVFCTTFLAYLFNSLSLRQLTPSTVSTYIFIYNLLLASIFAIIRDVDTIDKTKLLAALIFIGVYLVSTNPNAEKKIIFSKFIKINQMIHSMTGYGKQELNLNNSNFMIELKSLNSKQVDINIKMSSKYRDKEIELRRLISKKLQRGKIELSIWREKTEFSNNFKLNKKLIKDYYLQIDDLKKDLDNLGPSEKYEVHLIVT